MEKIAGLFGSDEEYFTWARLVVHGLFGTAFEAAVRRLDLLTLWLGGRAEVRSLYISSKAVGMVGDYAAAAFVLVAVDLTPEEDNAAASNRVTMYVRTCYTPGRPCALSVGCPVGPRT